MATISQVKNKNGVVTGYRVRVCVGRNEHYKQEWRTTTLPRPEGLTPKKEEKEIYRQAENWEQEQKEEFENEKERIKTEKKNKDKITLSDFIDKHWMKKHVKDGRHTPDTIAFYASMSGDIKAYFKGTFPGIRLNQIDKEVVLDYLSWMRNEAKTKKGTPYGATTIQHHFSTLRNILEYAVYVEYLQENPTKKLKATDRPQREPKEIDFLDESEAVRFMSCLDSEEEKEYWVKNHGSQLWWKCLCNTLILTGLRRGELVGLQWGDLDRKNLVLKIRRNVTLDTSNKGETEPEKKIHIGTTKGKTIRRVPISKYLLELLDELKKEQDEKNVTLLPSAYIFSRNGRPYLPIYPTEPTRLMRKYIKRHDLPDMSPHDLRHTAASLAIEAGANVKQIQQLLGHKDAATTLKFYAGITEQAAKETVEGIEGLLRPKEKEEEKKA